MKKLLLSLLTAISLSASQLEIIDFVDGWTYYTSDDITIRCKQTKCQEYDWDTSKWTKADFNQFSQDLQATIKTTIRESSALKVDDKI